MPVKLQAPIGRWQEEQERRNAVIDEPVVYLQRGADKLRDGQVQVQRQQFCLGEQYQRRDEQEKPQYAQEQECVAVHTETSFEMFGNR